MAFERLQQVLAQAAVDPIFREDLRAKKINRAEFQMTDEEGGLLDSMVESGGLDAVLDVLVAFPAATANADIPTVQPVPSSPIATDLIGAEAASATSMAISAISATPGAASAPESVLRRLDPSDIGRPVIAQLPFGMEVVQ